MESVKDFAKKEFETLRSRVPDASIFEYEDEILAICDALARPNNIGKSDVFMGSFISHVINRLSSRQSIQDFFLVGDDNRADLNTKIKVDEIMKKEYPDLDIERALQIYNDVIDSINTGDVIVIEKVNIKSDLSKMTFLKALNVYVNEFGHK